MEVSNRIEPARVPPGMDDLQGRGAIRWLLVVWEAFLFGWFLVVCWFEVGLWLRVAESVTVHEELPFTRWVRILCPETGVLFLLGLVLHMAGLGLLSAYSEEAVTSRIYRFVIVLVATAGFGASLPIADMFLTFHEGPQNVHGADESLFVGVGLILLICGIRKARKKR